MIHESYSPKRWISVLTGTLALCLLLAGPTTLAQINSSQNTLFISGQITNDENGAPIPDHQVYISSDADYTPGFEYFAVTKTDMNGFYFDTLVTTETDGAMRIYTYDFENNVQEGIFHFRFFWEDTYHLIGDLQVFDPNVTTVLQANFKAAPNNNEDDPLEIYFEDLSIGEGIQYWYWDFGDGKYSLEQNPVHHYAEKDIYMVTLTISNKPYIEENYLKSAITKQVQAGFREYYVLGGQVFAEYFPIDFGLAYLYEIDADLNLYPVDTVPIDTLGYYYFPQIIEGYYVTKARLQTSSVLYGKYIPTYFGNTMQWNNANKIRLNNEDSWENDIWLIISDYMTPGEGKIGGQIILDTATLTERTSPANNVEIVLLDNKSAGLTCAVSDVEGYFRFNDLAYGTYQIYPDVAGIPVSPMFVTISEEFPEVEDLILIIYNEEVTFGIQEESEFLQGAAFVYPNPATDQLKVRIEMKKASHVEARVTDAAGRLVLNQQYMLDTGSREFVIPVGQLPAGNYQVTLIPEDKVPATNKFLKVR